MKSKSVHPLSNFPEKARMRVVRVCSYGNLLFNLAYNHSQNLPEKNLTEIAETLEQMKNSFPIQPDYLERKLLYLRNEQDQINIIENNELSRHFLMLFESLQDGRTSSHSIVFNWLSYELWNVFNTYRESLDFSDVVTFLLNDNGLLEPAVRNYLNHLVSSIPEKKEKISKLKEAIRDRKRMWIKKAELQNFAADLIDF